MIDDSNSRRGGIALGVLLLTMLLCWGLAGCAEVPTEDGPGFVEEEGDNNLAPPQNPDLEEEDPEVLPDMDEPPVEPEQLYPEGPYGVELGEVISDLDFLTGDGTRLTFGSIHEAREKSVMVMVTGAGWCSSCREIHQKMQRLHEANEDVLVSLAMFEDANFQTPDADHVNSWAEQYSLDYPVLADDKGHLSAYFSQLSTSQVLVVKIETMTIAGLLSYWNDDEVEALIEAHR